jgi:hypothetical protein
MDYRLSDTFVGGVVPTSLSLLQRGVAPIALCSLLSWLFHVSYLRFSFALFVPQAYMPFTLMPSSLYACVPYLHSFAFLVSSMFLLSQSGRGL